MVYLILNDSYEIIGISHYISFEEAYDNTVQSNFGIGIVELDNDTINIINTKNIAY